MGYSRGECLTCYLQGFGNVDTDNQVHDVCFECLKKVCDGNIEKMRGVTSSYREDFDSVECKCDSWNSNFGLSTVDICEECEQKLNDCYRDQHGLLPEDYQEIECEHCHSLCKHHENNPGVHFLDLCIECLNIEYLIDQFRKGIIESNHSKLADLDSCIKEDLEERPGISYYEDNPDYEVKMVTCFCGTKFKESFYKYDSELERHRVVCNHDFDNIYQDVLRIKLTLDIERQYHRLGMLFFLPKEIWDLIRCIMIDSLIT